MFVIKNNPSMLGLAILATLLVSVAVLGALHVLPNAVKRAVTVFITFVAGAHCWLWKPPSSSMKTVTPAPNPVSPLSRRPFSLASR